MRLAVAALIVAAVALSLALYPRLPARVPTHWNLAGQIDNDAPKAIGAFIAPAIMLVMAGIFAVLPAISPAGFDIERKSRAYRAILLAILLFLLAIHVQVLLAALNVSRPIDTVVPLITGALFVVLGNYLPKMRRNFFIGIRTPWTLADEDVWFRTHRFAGPIFVACGVLLMAVGPFLRGAATEYFLIAVAAVASLASVIYSYAIYRRPDKGGVSS
jgi:uncharacterized membrane protein